MAVSYGVIQAFRFQRIASPLCALGTLITLKQHANKSVIQSSAYHYTEFVIQIRLTNHGNWKICDRLGHYLRQKDTVLASPMPFFSFREVVVGTGNLVFSY